MAITEDETGYRKSSHPEDGYRHREFEKEIENSVQSRAQEGSEPADRVEKKRNHTKSKATPEPFGWLLSELFPLLIERVLSPFKGFLPFELLKFLGRERSIEVLQSSSLSVSVRVRRLGVDEVFSEISESLILAVSHNEAANDQPSEPEERYHHDRHEYRADPIVDPWV